MKHIGVMRLLGYEPNSNCTRKKLLGYVNLGARVMFDINDCQIVDVEGADVLDQIVGATADLLTQLADDYNADIEWEIVRLVDLTDLDAEDEEEWDKQVKHMMKYWEEAPIILSTMPCNLDEVK